MLQTGSQKIRVLLALTAIEWRNLLLYGIVAETQLETFPIEDRVEIKLTTPVLGEGEIRGSILTWELPEDTWNKITAKIPEGCEGPLPATS